MICEIIGMDIINVSMYDGFIVIVEVMFMVFVEIKRKKVFFLEILYFRIIEIIKIYGIYRDVEFVMVFELYGVMYLSELKNFVIDVVVFIV